MDKFIYMYTANVYIHVSCFNKPCDNLEMLAFL